VLHQANDRRLLIELDWKLCRFVTQVSGFIGSHPISIVPCIEMRKTQQSKITLVHWRAAGQIRGKIGILQQGNETTRVRDWVQSSKFAGEDRDMLVIKLVGI
jgi:hypothetical protein